MKLLKNLKLKIIILFIVFLFFYLNSSVFASSHDYILNNNETLNSIVTDLIPSRWPHNGYIIFNSDDISKGNYVVLCYVPDQSIVELNNNNYFQISSNSFTRIYKLYYDLNGIFTNSNYNVSFTQNNGSCDILTFTNSDYLYSSIDLYNYNNELVNPLIPVPDKVVVPTLETAEELPKAILETLKMMIPVCLVLLGMGLIIYLIRRLRYWI